jgi:hypothetical protein
METFYEFTVAGMVLAMTMAHVELGKNGAAGVGLITKLDQ